MFGCSSSLTEGNFFDSVYGWRSGSSNMVKPQHSASFFIANCYGISWAAGNRTLGSWEFLVTGVNGRQVRFHCLHNFVTVCCFITQYVLFFTICRGFINVSFVFKCHIKGARTCSGAILCGRIKIVYYSIISYTKVPVVSSAVYCLHCSSIYVTQTSLRVDMPKNETCPTMFIVSH